jgi:hypothetical protein
MVMMESCYLTEAWVSRLRSRESEEAGVWHFEGRYRSWG